MSEITKIESSLPALLDNYDDGSLAVAGGNRANLSKRISIKGGVFRKIVGGKEVAAIEDRHMNVIFVKMAPDPSRTYYAKAYEEGVKVSPTCWSTDSKLPDQDVPTPVASSCSACPMSIEGSGNGGKGKACKLSWRTAVVLPNDPAGDVMQLVIPGGSCWGKVDGNKQPFKPYVSSLVAKGLRAGRVVTRMQFDTKTAGQRLQFSSEAHVPEEHLVTIMQQSQSEAAAAAVKFTVFRQDADVAGFETEVIEPVVASPEPKVRAKSAEEAAPAASDAAELIKRWSKK